KLDGARKLAAALTVMAAAGMDRVAVGVLERPAEHTQHGRGRHSRRAAQAFLDRLEAAGEASPGGLSLAWLRPGVTVVISDFLVEGEWSAALAGLRARRQ